MILLAFSLNIALIVQLTPSISSSLYEILLVFIQQTNFTKERPALVPKNDARQSKLDHLDDFVGDLIQILCMYVFKALNSAINHEIPAIIIDDVEANLTSIINQMILQ